MIQIVTYLNRKAGRKMKIAMIASGSRGDVQPYIALAKGLKEAGHHPRFISHENYSELVAQHHIDFRAVPGNVQAVAQSTKLTTLLKAGKFLSIMRIMGEEAKKTAKDLARVALDTCSDVDLIMGGLGGLEIGIAVGQKLERPVLPGYLLPFIPTQDFPSVLFPSMPGLLEPVLNKVSHQLTRQIMWQSLRKADELARREILGIKSAPFFGPYHADPLRNMPILYGFSEHVVPRPSDWPERAKICGYWFLNAEKEWTPPSKIVDFLESGTAPIYIGFGSMSIPDPEKTTRLIIDTLLKTKQRAIVQSGWGGLRTEVLPDSILLIDSVPHDWLFPRMAAVVHHGGVGTTASGFRAGIPSIIVPFFGDQPFWGRRAAKLGVGPQPIPMRKFSASKLAEAINISVSDKEMKLNAKQLGQRIRGEDGIAAAVAIINQIFS